MRQILCTLTCAGMLLAILMGCRDTSPKEPETMIDVEIRNESPYPMTHLFFASADSAGWGEDLLADKSHVSSGSSSVLNAIRPGKFKVKAVLGNYLRLVKEGISDTVEIFSRSGVTIDHANRVVIVNSGQ